MPEFVHRAGRIAQYLATEQPLVAWLAVVLLVLVWLGVAIVWPVAGAVILLATVAAFLRAAVPYVLRGVRDAARKTKEVVDG